MILSFELIQEYHLLLVINSTEGVSATTFYPSKPSPSTLIPEDTKHDQTESIQSTQCPFSHRVGKC